jgi:hypothetical protein
MRISRQGAKTAKKSMFLSVHCVLAALPARLWRAMDGQAGVSFFEMASSNDPDRDENAVKLAPANSPLNNRTLKISLY